MDVPGRVEPGAETEGDAGNQSRVYTPVHEDIEEASNAVNGKRSSLHQPARSRADGSAAGVLAGRGHAGTDNRRVVGGAA